jgi:hypothetical protein
VTAGEDVVVTLDEAPNGSATNQTWIALQPADAPVSDTAGRVVLERRQRVVRLRATTAGEHEIRLHDRYPKEDHHLIARVPVAVGRIVKTGVGQAAPSEECLDRWLTERKLDPFGNPEGTMYTGGTPLFDPATDRYLPRWDYVTTKWPEALVACERR